MGLNYDVITWMLPEVVSDAAITRDPDAAVGLYVLSASKIEFAHWSSSYYIRDFFVPTNKLKYNLR